MNIFSSTADLIDKVSMATGKLGALVLPLLIITILVNVCLRYIFDIGLIELEELQWHLNALVVLSCLSMTYLHDEHVRVDLFHNNFKTKTKLIVEICGVLFLFLPFCVLITMHAWNMAEYSWSLKEGSPMPSGLPARYIIKFVMALCLTLLTLQGVSVLLRNCLALFGIKQHSNISTSQSINKEVTL